MKLPWSKPARPTEADLQLQAKLIDLRAALMPLKPQTLVRILTEELATWHEGWTQQHVLEFNVGLEELAQRLGTSLVMAKEYLMNQAALQGIEV